MSALTAAAVGYLRKATLADLDALARLEQAGFHKDRFGREQFRYLLTQAHATTVVAEEGGRLCGAAILLWRKGSSRGRLYSIVVDPAFRGQGLGSRLLEACERAALEQGCRLLSLEVRVDNPRAIAFYQQHGFQIKGRLPDYYEDGAPALKMAKALRNRFSSNGWVAARPANS